jgi:hypothetical protein
MISIGREKRGVHPTRKGEKILAVGQARENL